LEGGSETCPDCLDAYWVEMEVRCVVCDRAACAACMVIVRGARPVCRECGPAASRPEPS
jgi:hypothetical protein